MFLFSSMDRRHWSSSADQMCLPHRFSYQGCSMYVIHNCQISSLVLSCFQCIHMWSHARHVYLSFNSSSTIFSNKKNNFLFVFALKIYEVPNEDFNYTYLIRATVVFIGVYLFFIVEKLLRFRFKVDEVEVLSLVMLIHTNV
jgi:hypothetical protein